MANENQRLVGVGAVALLIGGLAGSVLDGQEITPEQRRDIDAVIGELRHIDSPDHEVDISGYTFNVSVHESAPNPFIQVVGSKDGEVVGSMGVEYRKGVSRQDIENMKKRIVDGYEMEKARQELRKLDVPSEQEKRTLLSQ